MRFFDKERAEIANAKKKRKKRDPFDEDLKESVSVPRKKKKKKK